MSTTLQYNITFLSDWHVGSGLDAGTNVDALVAKTDQNLPFIPGKTIKGLLRDALKDMVEVEKADQETINEIFGTRSIPGNNNTNPGNAFFSNAYLLEEEQLELVSNSLQPFLYKTLTSTKINSTGTAQSGSLRSIEVCIPVNLEGTIILNDPDHANPISKAGKLVRYLGVQRNRGLGRCSITITKKT